MKLDIASRICTVGDLHFKPNNLTESTVLANLIAEKIPDDIDAVVLLGDVLDNHANVHSQAYNVAYNLLNKLTQKHDVYLLVGNHDYINNSQFCTAEHPYNAFKQWPRVMVVDEPMFIQIKTDLFVMTPYIPVGRFVEALDKLPDWKHSAKCIFAHQEFAGIMFKDQGDSWPLDCPPVISGHIHDRRQLQKNVLYIGTPIQHSFAENTDKGISVFSGAGEQRISLDMPTKQTLESNLDTLESVVIPSNSNTRLILHVTPTEWAAFRKTKQFKTLTAAKVKIVPVPPTDQNTAQLKQMAKNRRTYMDALEDAVAAGSKHMKQAFETVMKNVG